MISKTAYLTRTSGNVECVFTACLAPFSTENKQSNGAEYIKGNYDMEDIGEQGVDHALDWLSLKENYLSKAVFVFPIYYTLLLSIAIDRQQCQ